MGAQMTRSSSFSPSITESQKRALITLLGDEDPLVYRAVRGKLLSFGTAAGEWVRAHRLSNDPVLRRRSLEILEHFARAEADDQFLAFCLNQGEELNLEQGIWLLVRTRYPDVNPEAYAALLDSYAGELALRTKSLKSGREILAVFREFFFEILRFSGNEHNYYEPENSYFNRVLDRRTGNPISLSLLYLLLARRLQLPIAGIGLPGHFICRYQSSTEEMFVDAFNRGKLLTKADCIRYLAENYPGYQEGFLTPISTRRILLRVCSNLHQAYSNQDSTAEVERLQRYLVALAR